MSFQINLPPSLVSKMAKEEGRMEAEVEMGKPKREDWKKLKELEEARKAGTAPAMKDEEGKDINPHIPQYIMQAPWYYGSLAPTLKHQRVQEEGDERSTLMNQWYKKGVKAGPVATKFRKGACENCGAMTHKKKDCLERPRRVGARFTGEQIAPDEHINTDIDFDYDGKRDRWNGYDTSEHSRIVEEFAKIDEAKRQLKASRLDSAAARQSSTSSTGAGEDGPERGEADSEDEDEDKYADDVDMPGQKFETKQRITVRNLRIREDMAKYLYNLDPNSAYYDPKTRSMRENPLRNAGSDDAEVSFAGDNFVRWSGDAHNMAKQQLFAWEAYEKGQEAHLQADPTKLELLSKEFNRKKQVFKDSQKQSILSKYGGEEHLEAPSRELLVDQTENYVEYSRTGTILKGHERAPTKSRYEEDVYINNHTAVWGSFWQDGQWGYACCHSFIKESYCTGKSGQEAIRSSTQALMPPPPVSESPPTEPPGAAEVPHAEAASTSEARERPENAAVVPVPPEQNGGGGSEAVERAKQTVAESSSSAEKRAKRKREKKRKKKMKKKEKKKKEKKRSKKRKRKDSSDSSSSSSSESSSSDESSENEEEMSERKIREAMKRQEMQDRRVERLMEMDERKRPYNSMYDFRTPTDVEMEAFRRRQQRSDDPMAQFLK